MKKIITVLLLAVMFAACGNGPGSNRKVDTVYVSKPKVDTNTVLKAHMQMKVWAAVFQTLDKQAQKLGRPLDTAQARKAKDSIYMSINTLSRAISDSVVNKPYF